MDKRSEARQKRINEVLEHKNIVDLSEDLCRLHEIESKVNSFYSLNLRYAFAKMDVDYLLQNGWQIVSHKADTDSIQILYLVDVFEVMEVKLVLSKDDEWLALFCGDDFKRFPWDCNLPDKLTNILEKELTSAVKELPPQTYAEEYQACLKHCPPLFTSRGKPIDIKQESFSSLWSRIQHYWMEKEPYHSIAYTFSLLRHKPEDGCYLHWIALDLTVLGPQFKVGIWKAIACLLLLEYEPDGCICTHYYSLIPILSHWKMYQAALYCSYVSWLYAPTQSSSSFKELPVLMRLALGQLLEKQNVDGIERILSEVEYIEDKFAVPEMTSDAMYLRALLAVRDSDYEEAAKLLGKAESLLLEAGEEKMTEREEELLPAVRACRKLLGHSKGKKIQKIVRESLLNYLEYYPTIPGRDLWKGSTLPEFFSYPGHGMHWKAVFGHEEIEEEMIKVFNLWPKFAPASKYLFGIKKGTDVTIYRTYYYKDKKNTPLEIMGIVSMGAQNNKDSHNYVASLFPTREAGEEGRIITKAVGFAIDDKHYEYLMEIELPHGSIEFFLIHGDYDSLWENQEYTLELSAWGYSLSKLKPFEIEMNLPTGKKGKSTLEKVHIDDSLRNLTNTPNGYRDDIDFVARVASIKKLTFLGNPMLWLLLEFDERAWDLKLPLFINVNSLAEGYKPKVGDVVTGTAWLQGRILEEADDEDEQP